MRERMHFSVAVPVLKRIESRVNTRVTMMRMVPRRAHLRGISTNYPPNGQLLGNREANPAMTRSTPQREELQLVR